MSVPQQPRDLRRFAFAVGLLLPVSFASTLALRRVEAPPRDEAASGRPMGGGIAVIAVAGASGTRTASFGALSPRRLTVTSEPSGSSLALTLPDGSIRTGRTPFRDTLSADRVLLTLSRSGYQGLSREIAIEGDRSLSFWLDPSGLLHQSLLRFETGSNPKQVAFSPDGREIWASLLGGRGVEIFSSETGERIGQVTLGKHGAVEVIFTSDGKTVYASQMESASVFEIDRASRTVRRQLPTRGSWTKVMVLSADERTLYAANWVSNDVAEIDLTSGKVRRSIPTVKTRRGLYLSPEGSRLFVAGYDGGDIQRIDLKTGASKILLHSGGAMRHLVGDGRGRLYADDMALDRVYVIDLATEAVRVLAQTNEKPNTIDLTPDGRVLYVSNRGENGSSYYQPGPEWGSVLAIDTESGKVLDAIVGGNQPTGLDVSPDGRRLAFSDFLDNRVRVYAIPPYDALARGNGGRAIAHLRELAKQR